MARSKQSKRRQAIFLYQVIPPNRQIWSREHPYLKTTTSWLGGNNANDVKPLSLSSHPSKSPDLVKGSSIFKNIEDRWYRSFLAQAMTIFLFLLSST